MAEFRSLPIGEPFISARNYGITISNPGGFVEGVTLDNLLSRFYDFGERIKINSKQIRVKL